MKPETNQPKPIFDLKWVKAELDKAEVQEDLDCAGNSLQMFFLGTVFNVFPSGKFYTFFTMSNVTSCENQNCGECEVCLDQAWIDQAQEELETINAYLHEGEFDPCDVFIARNKD